MITSSNLFFSAIKEEMLLFISPLISSTLEQGIRFYGQLSPYGWFRPTKYQSAPDTNKLKMTMAHYRILDIKFRAVVGCSKYKVSNIRDLG